MAQISSEKAVQTIGNRYDLVLIASHRARELKRGYLPKIKDEGHGPVIASLREIEEGHIGREYLKKI